MPSDHGRVYVGFEQVSTASFCSCCLVLTRSEDGGRCLKINEYLLYSNSTHCADAICFLDFVV